MTLLRFRRIMAQRLLHQEAVQLQINASDLSRVERRVIPPSPRIAKTLEAHHGKPMADLLREVEPLTLLA